LPQKTRTKVQQGKKVCSNCHKDKPYSKFYQATNPQASSGGGVVNVCSDCVKKESINSDGTLNIEKFKHMLMLMDKAFVPVIVESAIEETRIAIETNKGRKDLIGNYMKGLNLSQNKMSFLESISALETGKNISTSVTTAEKKQKEKEEIFVKTVDDFVVTDDILEIFGEGYTKSEYRQMQKKYETLKKNYPMKTSLHQEALATYVRFKVKEEMATAAGNVGEAKEWNKAAQEAADKGRISPKSLTQADLQGGLNSFCELFKVVEQAVDIIPILPRFKYRPNDAIDFNIWCYVNYIRNLEGKPECEYADVYKFYDIKKEQYIKQYGDPNGIFNGDTSPINREKIEEFIQLPEDIGD
jgi:hypothetical protein